MSDDGKIRAVIVDDEDLARKVLSEYAGSEPDLEVVAECANGFDAVKAIGELKPDLVFLDVQMPKLSGFEVLELIGREVAVIFVTAYDTYAMKAFDAHAVDYLLKPYTRDRFRTALDRARQRLRSRARAPSSDRPSFPKRSFRSTSPPAITISRSGFGIRDRSKDSAAR